MTQPFWSCRSDSSVCIATRYALDGPGIECPWLRDFTHPSRPALGPTAGAWLWAPILSSLKFKEILELYLYFPFGSSWPVLGWTFTFGWKRRRNCRVEYYIYYDETGNEERNCRNANDDVSWEQGNIWKWTLSEENEVVLSTDVNHSH
jgi:hypothetical protein